MMHITFCYLLMIGSCIQQTFLDVVTIYFEARTWSQISWVPHVVNHAL
jgi:hypothetical protein